MKLRRKFFLSILFAVVMTALLTVSAFAKPALNKKKAKISTGQSVTLKVKGTKQKPKWTSSNKKIATVSQKGVVTGRSAGNVIIKAKVAGKTLKCKVTVIAPSSANAGTGSTGSTGDNTNSPVSIEPTNGFGGGTIFTFIMDLSDHYAGRLARLAVELFDKQEQKSIWIYSSGLVYGQSERLGIDTERYRILSVGYQIHYFDWGREYYAYYPYDEYVLPNKFTLSGTMQHPRFEQS